MNTIVLENTQCSNVAVSILDYSLKKIKRFDNIQNILERRENMVFAKVKKYCEEKKISIAAFEKLCGIGNGTVARWEQDESRPSLQSLEKMQQATGIKVTEWLN